MSILGGMVDSHHEMELNPSTRLVTSNWFVRHAWTILALGAALVLSLCAGTVPF